MDIKKRPIRQSLERLILPAVVAIFVILPFSTPLTVFLGSHLNHLSLFKVWKEIAMVAVVAIILLSGMHKPLAHIKERGLKILVWLIFVYAGWTLLLGLLGLTVLNTINWEAFVYSVIVNLRFLFFLLLCWLIAQGSNYLQTHWQKLVLVPAAIVIAFGLLQAFMLPANVLEHIGYGPHTITPYQTVDQNPEYVRIQSTLRGPNPLGAYLIVVVTVLVAGLNFKKRWWLKVALLGGSLLVLFYSYSRSAWLGIIATFGALVYISITHTRLRRSLIIFGVAALLLFGGLVYLGRDVQFIQKAVFHSDETSQSPESSNEQRAGAMQRGLHDVLHEPFGRGPGSAGPASFHNDHAERIAENYYLQIGQEVGWPGLLLFIMINIQVAVLLWQRRDNVLARIALASLAGITLVNLLSHAWTDETLSLLWWGMAGIAIASFARGTMHDNLEKPPKT